MMPSRPASAGGCTSCVRHDLSRQLVTRKGADPTGANMARGRIPTTDPGHQGGVVQWKGFDRTVIYQQKRCILPIGHILRNRHHPMPIVSSLRSRKDKDRDTAVLQKGTGLQPAWAGLPTAMTGEKRRDARPPCQQTGHRGIPSHTPNSRQARPSDTHPVVVLRERDAHRQPPPEPTFGEIPRAFLS